MDASINAIKEQFGQFFGSDGLIRVVRAPGRVNLIGEHTDYNDGFVFPMAIEPEVRVVCRAREDGKIRLASTVFPGQIAEFSLHEKITRGEPGWANYSRGVAAELLAAGTPLTGMDAMISNTLPVGGGLSSSAAIEVATAWAFLALGGLEIDASRLALLCQKAEHEYALVPCGIMDQTIVISARAGHAMLLDCRDLSRQFVPLDPRELRVVIVNSMVKHELSGGEYAQRRHQCEEGVAFFKKQNPAIKALRDVSPKQVDEAKKQLSDVVYRRCRHVVSENARTVEAAMMLGRKDYERVGELMIQSHNSLRDDYEVSCPELDFLASEAMKIKGVYGARMTGGGFGGCIVALAQPRSVDALVEHLSRTYAEKFNLKPNAFVTTPAAGAGVLD
ncbi:MAG TPA: galactokinase [Tepidisphaeraceae bacterium]|nr:galactokinase [Tepidisphaeraceae bacterium]